MDNDHIVIIPTYNERDNIVKLVDEINALNLSLDILVVDDNSPDGTGDVVESLKGSKSNLEVLHREKKEGIGPAYIEGFRYALDKGRYKYIIQMDGDFSHNPKDIPRLLEGAGKNDVVVGSRYIKEGMVSGKWSIFRKFLSKGGNFYARFITGLKIKDCTAGFKCYKRRALQSIDFNKKFLNGYGFQIHILYELNRNDFTICEIPIFFEERKKGTSKMNLGITLEAFFSLIFIRLKDRVTKQ